MLNVETRTTPAPPDIGDSWNVLIYNSIDTYLTKSNLSCVVL